MQVAAPIISKCFLDTREPSPTSNLLLKQSIAPWVSGSDIGRELFRSAPGSDIGNRAERLIRRHEDPRARERRRSVAAGRQGGRRRNYHPPSAGPSRHLPRSAASR